ncbi:hypothetical protein APP86_15875 [Salmonella enterica subsp. houtenae]|nr:hypothetical protein SEH50133_20544 [Salmonella enterica subsp. houtenae serovar 50:g,z51:- str. 01-0133]OIV03403.1 hypothetical protein APP86_15875 [Salmonella enterica subsp. houtenae]VEA89866.1 Uncharacterised protein [Salmonella enterica subsp. houtenae]
MHRSIFMVLGCLWLFLVMVFTGTREPVVPLKVMVHYHRVSTGLLSVVLEDSSLKGRQKFRTHGTKFAMEQPLGVMNGSLYTRMIGVLMMALG